MTIGFARRFTGYKRPELVFLDIQRLAAIVNAPRWPVQIVFAGKAHPADGTGKRHLQRVYQTALDPALGGRIAFVDDYDLHVAHFIVQGCNVWLNNPRKPFEASGTSGMKASLNGVPHLSVWDGWWAEGYTGRNGWLIHGATLGDDQDTADEADAQALYRLLEEQVIPAFYERDEQGIPQRWLQVVAGRDPDGRAPLQRAPHDQAIRRGDVPPGTQPRSHDGCRTGNVGGSPTDRWMVDDLDPVTVRITNVERPRAVPVRSGTAAQGDAVSLQVGRPRVDVLGGTHDQAQVIECRVLPAVSVRRPVQGEVVGTRRQIGVVGVRLPLDPKPQLVDVEALGLLEGPHGQREVAKAQMLWSITHAPMLVQLAARQRCV